MRRALVLTAFDRPDYLSETLESWASVNMDGWDLTIRIEPSDQQEKILEIIGEWSARYGILHELIVNDTVLGVLLHPWVAFEDLFNRGYDFVVRAEDDLLVSRDILRYFTWASALYEDDERVATVHAYSKTTGDRWSTGLGTDFNPLIWGTWIDRWIEYIGPTWDKDYSTNNGTPHVHAGWDWNLNERVLPRLGKQVLTPDRSRVQNIGLVGTHSTPENFEQSLEWLADYGQGRFWSRDRPLADGRGDDD